MSIRPELRTQVAEMTDVITTDARKELWFKTSVAPPPPK